MNTFKRIIEAVRMPSAATLAQRELEDAQRELLKAHSAREYAEAMATYHQRRISRLQAALSAMRPAANDDTRSLRAAA